MYGSAENIVASATVCLYLDSSCAIILMRMTIRNARNALQQQCRLFRYRRTNPHVKAFRYIYMGFRKMVTLGIYGNYEGIMGILVGDSAGFRIYMEHA